MSRVWNILKKQPYARLRYSFDHRASSFTWKYREYSAGSVEYADPVPQFDSKSFDWDRGGNTKSNSLTPLYSLSKKYIEANPGAVCLIQVGSFYELYFEQAETYGSKLGLKVATRKTSNHNVPMAGFPVIQLQKYVKILVQDLQVNVAIIDQFPGEETIGDKMIHRKVSRIVTPGTLVDETFMNYNENNYLLAISFPTGCNKQPHDPDMPVGISWIDLSVGDFYVQQTSLSELISDISRVNPSEIIISKEFINEDLPAWYSGLHDLRKYFIRYHKTAYNDLKLSFKSNLNGIRKLIETFSVREEAAMNMVLSYINVNLPERNPSLDLPMKYWNEKYLQMDSRTRDALELIERNSGTSGKSLTVGSLLNTIKKTVTPSGTRLLTEWIKSPILDIDEIKHRQEFVKFFLNNQYQATIIEKLLNSIDDFVRSAQRLTLGTGDTIGNLKSISSGLQTSDELKQFLTSNRPSEFEDLIDNFLMEFKVPSEIATEINDTFEVVSLPGVEGVLEEDTITELESNTSRSQDMVQFMVKKDHNDELKELHESLAIMKDKESILFASIRDKFLEIDDKLTVQIKQQHAKFYDVIYVNGKSKSIDLINKEFQEHIRDKRKNMVLFKSNDWKFLQFEISQQLEKIQELENQIINNLKEKTVQKVVEIRRLSKLLDFLDVTLSFSKLSHEFNLCCPQFIQGNQLVIEEGRHIVVESSLKNIGSNFTSNNTKLNRNSKQWIITGPNMGGKSTFLRQNAIIVVLAQIGCFVPASKCQMDTVDKLFTRIGASDDLFNDLSTFMVEMVEVSNILKNATKKSLAIVDEVGRGTSGREGLAIAYATLVSLIKVNKCRTLFATHFGNEIKQLLDSDSTTKQSIGFFKTGVVTEKQGDQIHLTINHKLEEGISERSYAIEVAQLAGFPKYSLKIANKAYKAL